MDERIYTDSTIAQLQAIGLQCEVTKILQSRAWQIVRGAYPNCTNGELLFKLVQYEALRIALRGGKTKCKTIES